VAVANATKLKKPLEPTEWDREHPSAPYLVLSGTFLSTCGALLLAGRDRLPERIATEDLVLLALATHKLSRVIARDRVTRPLRAPFTEVEGPDAPVELNEHARGRGLRHAVGELISCPYCLDQWIAGGFVAGLIALPRQTRAVAGMFAVVTGSDFLQYLLRWVRANG
jgi:hypothetical protein